MQAALATALRETQQSLSEAERQVKICLTQASLQARSRWRPRDWDRLRAAGTIRARGCSPPLLEHYRLPRLARCSRPRERFGFN